MMLDLFAGEAIGNLGEPNLQFIYYIKSGYFNTRTNMKCFIDFSATIISHACVTIYNNSTCDDCH